MSALKNIYSPAFYKRLSEALKKSIPGFDRDTFISLINSNGFEDMELKARMRHTSIVLHHFMPKEFPKAVPVLVTIIENLRNSGFAKTALPVCSSPIM